MLAGVLQGGTLAPFLFVLSLDYALLETHIRSTLTKRQSSYHSYYIYYWYWSWRSTVNLRLLTKDTSHLSLTRGYRRSNLITCNFQENLLYDMQSTKVWNYPVRRKQFEASWQFHIPWCSDSADRKVYEDQNWVSLEHIKRNRIDRVESPKLSKNKFLSSHSGKYVDLKAELRYSLFQIRSLSDSLHINKNENVALCTGAWHIPTSS